MKLPEEFDAALDSYERFFDVSIERPEIIEVSTRAEFERETGMSKTPDWMAAFAKRGKVIIFSKTSLEQESCHSRDAWEELVRHELAHLYFMKKFGTIFPLWLNEGLACYLSGQKKKVVSVGCKDIMELSTIEGFMHAENRYERAYSLVKKLL